MNQKSRGRNPITSIVRVVTAVLFAASVIVLGGATGAFATGCNVTRQITSGTTAKATVKTHCPTSSKIYATGSVTYLKPDHGCAYVKITFADHSTWKSPKACVRNVAVKFTSTTHSGQTLTATLVTVGGSV